MKDIYSSRAGRDSTQGLDGFHRTSGSVPSACYVRITKLLSVGYAANCSQTHFHRQSVLGSWEESLSLKTSHFLANPSEMLWRTVYKQGLLILKQIDVKKVPYKYGEMPYTKEMRAVVQDKFQQ